MSAYSSACQSCDSICVVSGFQVSPRPSTKSRETACQSDLGDRGVVGGVRARRPVELAQVLRGVDPLELAAQPVREDRELLAHGRRRGRLTVGAGEHGDRAVGAGHGRHLLGQGGRRGQPDLADRALDEAGVGEVVDVLAGAGEVDELPDVLQRRALQAPLEQVLHGLDVVDRGPLDLAQLVDGAGVEVRGDAVQALDLLVGEAAQARQHLLLGQVQQPGDLDAQPLAVERRLRQVLQQALDGGAVAAVERAEGGLAEVGGDAGGGPGHGGLLAHGPDPHRSSGAVPHGAGRPARVRARSAQA